MRYRYLWWSGAVERKGFSFPLPLDVPPNLETPAYGVARNVPDLVGVSPFSGASHSGFDGVTYAVWAERAAPDEREIR